MILTEETAKKKWCPMATITAKDSDAVGNREYGKPVQTCIASDCMMWRAADANYGSRETVKQGYCGLAGKL